MIYRMGMDKVFSSVKAYVEQGPALESSGRF
jgi:hypothetical protein